MRRNSDDDGDPFDVFDQIDELMQNGTDGDVPVDVHEGDDRIRIVADIPGATEDGIDLQCDGRTLVIRASTESGPYVKRVDLPSYVDEQSATFDYNNGILEVVLDRDTDPANIGFY